MRSTGFSLVLSMMFASVAVAQTTQPAPTAGPAPAAPVTPEQVWGRTVQAFAKSLADGDLNGANVVLSPKSTVRRFDSAANQEAWRIFERVNKSVVVGHHAYLNTPLVMAADVAADFKNAAGVPDDAKAKFLIDDETEMKRANATAAQWMMEQVSARNGTPVGVIVLWALRPTARVVEASKAEHEVVFVLCRGEEAAQGAYRISSVVYGVPVRDDAE